MYCTYFSCFGLLRCAVNCRVYVCVCCVRVVALVCLCRLQSYVFMFSVVVLFLVICHCFIVVVLVCVIAYVYTVHMFVLSSPLYNTCHALCFVYMCVCIIIMCCFVVSFFVSYVYVINCFVCFLCCPKGAHVMSEALWCLPQSAERPPKLMHLPSVCLKAVELWL